MTDRTDEETVELIREWLQQYGLTVIIGIVLGVAAISGYRWWENRNTETRYQQSAQLDDIRSAIAAQNFVVAEKNYQLLKQQHSDIAGLAALSMAAGYELLQDKNDLAEKFLQAASTDGNDLLVQQTARWQAALLAAQNGRYDEAEKLLATLRDSAYTASSFALQGYIDQKQGKWQQAVQAYQSSRELMPNNTVTEQLNAATARLATDIK